MVIEVAFDKSVVEGVDRDVPSGEGRRFEVGVAHLMIEGAVDFDVTVRSVVEAPVG
ncbi:hypothetical protein [Nocardia barduliensis]|uniref:hypothetical protein n=1 Tax=Nocardia barduliensis TaxID=2736643 RepID=UPI001574870A|nr:hypothetical protein [Nocardia barduliensis]